MTSKELPQRESIKIRRRYPRFNPRDKLQAKFESSGLEVEGEVRELSVSGFFLAIQDAGVAESQGTISIRLPEWILVSDGAIRSVVPGKGFGIEFLEMRPRDQRVLIWYCHYLAFTGPDSGLDG